MEVFTLLLFLVTLLLITSKLQLISRILKVFIIITILYILIGITPYTDKFFYQCLDFFYNFLFEVFKGIQKYVEELLGGVLE